MDSSKKIKKGQIEQITIADVEDLANQLATFLTQAALNGYATEAWVATQNFLKSVNWGDIGGAITNQTDLKNALESKGVQLTADQPNAMVYLKDANGNTISSLNVGFLNNEGTTIAFNSANDTIELKDDQGNVLSSFPVSALVSNMPDNLNLNGTSLELRDVSNNILSSVTIQMANIEGLPEALADKYDKTGGKITGNVGIGVDPTEALDVGGKSRIRDVPEGINPFLTIDPDGNLRQMDARQAAMYLSPFVEVEPTVICELPPTKPTIKVLTSAEPITVNNESTGATIGLRHRTLGLLEVEQTYTEPVFVPALGNTETSFTGTVEIIWDGEKWYKIN